MPNMPIGPYRLEVALQGFRTYVQTGIVLQVGATPTLNTTLAVGNLEETVSVEAAAPLVDVRSAGISEVVEQERIVELPLQGRQVTDLITLAGAAVNTGRVTQLGIAQSVAISVAGGLRSGVGYTLDGAMHNNTYDNSNLPFPFPDALQEFRVATSGLSADNGMHSSASVNAVVKSGTNSLHGNAFEFLRDRRFNARSPFAPVGPDGKRLDDGLNRNQFGGTLGGPIVRDRLFFFGAYQRTRTIETPPDNLAFVPTAAMLAGDFTAAASPLCNGGRQVALTAPFAGNRLDPARFSPAAVKIANHELFPKSTHPCGEIRFKRAGQHQRRAARLPGRLSVERQSLDLRAVHGYVRARAGQPGRDEERAHHYRHAEHLQACDDDGVRRYARVRVEHGQRVPCNLGEDVHQIQSAAGDLLRYHVARHPGPHLHPRPAGARRHERVQLRRRAVGGRDLRQHRLPGAE